jgi:hypothetical protein
LLSLPEVLGFKLSAVYQRHFHECRDHQREDEVRCEDFESSYSVERPDEYSAFIMGYDSWSLIMMPDPSLPRKWSMRCDFCLEDKEVEVEVEVTDSVTQFELVSDSAPPVLMFMCEKSTSFVSKEFSISKNCYCLSAVLYYWKILNGDNSSAVWHYTCDVQKGGVWFHCDDTEINEVLVLDGSCYSVRHENGVSNDFEAFDSDYFGDNGGDNVDTDVARGKLDADINVGNGESEKSQCRYPFLCIYSLVNDKDEVDWKKKLGAHLTLMKARK